MKAFSSENSSNDLPWSADQENIIFFQKLEIFDKNNKREIPIWKLCFASTIWWDTGELKLRLLHPKMFSSLDQETDSSSFTIAYVGLQVVLSWHSLFPEWVAYLELMISTINENLVAGSNTSLSLIQYFDYLADCKYIILNWAIC